MNDRADSRWRPAAVGGPPLVVAHRAVSGPAPENSLEAIAGSLAAGVDAIEVDVRATADGVLLLSHDPEVDGIHIGSATLAHIERAVGARPATLAEALELASGRMLLDIEVKESGCEEAVAAALARVPACDLLVTSFSDAVVARMRELLPHATVGLLLGLESPRNRVATRAAEVFPDSRLRAAGADLAAPNEGLLRAGVLGRITKAGFGVAVWTVNDDARLARLLADPRVDAVITDRPLAAIALRDSVRAGD